MKFEKPVAEIEKFDLMDIVATSGEVLPTGEAYDTMHEGECVGGAPDNDETDCL